MNSSPCEDSTLGEEDSWETDTWEDDTWNWDESKWDKSKSKKDSWRKRGLIFLVDRLTTKK